MEESDELTAELEKITADIQQFVEEVKIQLGAPQWCRDHHIGTAVWAGDVQDP